MKIVSNQLKQRQSFSFRDLGEWWAVHSPLELEQMDQQESPSWGRRLQEGEAEKKWAREAEWREHLAFVGRNVVIRLPLLNLKRLEIGGQVDSASHAQQNRD